VILYEDFAKSNARRKLEDKMEDDDDAHEKKREGKDTSQIHVLQALQYLRKVCNHPVLVASPEHPLYDKVVQYLAKDNTTLHDISHSAKLLALK
jgi:TATA-binding protein-associated factor